LQSTNFFIAAADIISVCPYSLANKMIKTKFIAAIILTLLAVPVLADPIPAHNTGVDAANALVAPGAQTAFWTLSAKPPAAVPAIGSNPFRYYNGSYFADTTTAAWVAPQADGNAGVNGTYTYDLAIDLSGLDPATASISGTFGTDNAGAVWLNGDAPVATTGSASFAAPTPFSINSGFVAGLNTLHVQVNNEGDPTAFFVSITSATANAVAPPVPAKAVPASSWPLLAGLGLILLLTGLASLLHRRV
jgi:hypothetical protein